VGRIIEDKIKSFFVDEVLFGRLSSGGKAAIDWQDGEYRIVIEDSAPKKAESLPAAEARAKKPAARPADETAKTPADASL
jgi:uncharacterized protein YaiL (DUF2058 family)